MVAATRPRRQVASMAVERFGHTGSGCDDCDCGSFESDHDPSAQAAVSESPDSSASAAGVTKRTRTRARHGSKKKIARTQKKGTLRKPTKTAAAGKHGLAAKATDTGTGTGRRKRAVPSAKPRRAKKPKVVIPVEPAPNLPWRMGCKECNQVEAVASDICSAIQASTTPGSTERTDARILLDAFVTKLKTFMGYAMRSACQNSAGDDIVRNVLANPEHIGAELDYKVSGSVHWQVPSVLLCVMHCR